MPLRDALTSRRRLVMAAALLAGAWRLAFLNRPLAPDEGGLLLLARQWSPGSSLYGDYFVDRPPGLVGLVWLADAAGGELALRLTAVAAVVASVLLADRLGALTTGQAAGGTAAALATAIYLSLPTSGVLDTNAEMLACPAVLGGLVLVLRALRTAGYDARAAWGWSFAAGCAGALAIGVKQSIADVFVVGLAAVVALAWAGRPRAAATVMTGVGAGAATVLLALLGLAWRRGTDPAALWHALVGFRFEALGVIGSSAGEVNADRAWLLLGSFLLSGGLVILVGGWVASRRAPVPAGQDLSVRWLLLPLLAFEVTGVALGGSYWLHYLLLLTPGIAWCSALMATRRRARVALVGTLVWAGLVAGSGIAVATERDLADPTDRAVVEYLERHARPGDTATVAFGRPNILAETGLSSPYPQLWSLPVRVLDPELRELRRVLRSPQRPTWVVAAGRDLTTWGVDAEAANEVLARHYDIVARVEGATIYRRSGIVVP